MIDNRSIYLNTHIVSPAQKNGLHNTFQTMKDYEKKGLYHRLIPIYQHKYGNLNTNIILPYVNKNNITDLIVVNNIDDGERLASKHVKKMPHLDHILFNSIISTTCVDDWKNQRSQYQPAFSVHTELVTLIPISVKRAKYCVDLLYELCLMGTKSVNMNDFLLNETMAQLQLAMFGVSDDFQVKTNKNIRKVFSGENSPTFTQTYFKEMVVNMDQWTGPLSKAFDLSVDKKELFGNIIIFSFAGHDTTGNTLSWLLYELCKNKSCQSKLHHEIDLFWMIQKNKNIEYNDFKRLPYLTKCIMETLRLWSPIPNGTFRELIEDDYVVGKNGKHIKLPKGTYIQIPNWSRHRNADLWGDDVNTFNPDREFKDDELWENSVINTYNPSTPRFSPFTYGPRDCIGKNFSQIEMRIILLYLLKSYRFSLTKKETVTEYNTFTLGFLDGLYMDVERRESRTHSKL